MLNGIELELESIKYCVNNEIYIYKQCKVSTLCLIMLYTCVPMQVLVYLYANAGTQEILESCLPCKL